jgi:hypothetical protein
MVGVLVHNEVFIDSTLDGKSLFLAPHLASAETKGGNIVNTGN